MADADAGCDGAPCVVASAAIATSLAGAAAASVDASAPFGPPPCSDGYVSRSQRRLQSTSVRPTSCATQDRAQAIGRERIPSRREPR
eukprot:6192767-Pleurochrysis_carterae.AAC.7